MNKKNVAFLAGAVLAGLAFAYFILGRTIEEPSPLVEDYEGVVDSMKVDDGWNHETLEEEEAAPDTAADSIPSDIN